MRLRLRAFVLVTAVAWHWLVPTTSVRAQVTEGTISLTLAG
jgi:hypothetical protein